MDTTPEPKYSRQEEAERFAADRLLGTVRNRTGYKSKAKAIKECLRLLEEAATGMVWEKKFRVKKGATK